MNEVVVLQGIDYEVIGRRAISEKHGMSFPAMWDESQTQRPYASSGEHLYLQLIPTLGSIAFNAYRSQQNGRTYDDKKMPYWWALTPEIRKAWTIAAMVVIQAYQAENTL